MFNATSWKVPKTIRLDNRPEFKPTDNAFIEGFNGRFRAECLNAHWFMSLGEYTAKDGDLIQVLQ